MSRNGSVFLYDPVFTVWLISGPREALGSFASFVTDVYMRHTLCTRVNVDNFNSWKSRSRIFRTVCPILHGCAILPPQKRKKSLLLFLSKRQINNKHSQSAQFPPPKWKQPLRCKNQLRVRNFRACKCTLGKKDPPAKPFQNMPWQLGFHKRELKEVQADCDSPSGILALCSMLFFNVDWNQEL